MVGTSDPASGAFSLSGFIPSKGVLLSLTFYIVDLTKSYGMGVPELSQSLRRVPCSGCGLSKRYILSKEAYNHGFTVVAMDYNLDNEAATLMGNILHCEMGSLVRQSPLPTTGEKLVKRVKSL
jgi:tRNA(Ile)-lysidine synthase TilS/MesJ